LDVEAHRALLKACEENDFAGVREAGWMPVFNALNEWWAAHFVPRDLRPYVDVLRDEKPTDVYMAVDGLRGEEWRPPPSKVYRQISESKAKADSRLRARAALNARDNRPDQSTTSLMRVRQLLDSGTKVCMCAVRPVQLVIEEVGGERWSTEDLERFRKQLREWYATRIGSKPMLPDHVIRCAKCNGIELGQAYAAEDLLSPEPDFKLPPS